MKRSPATSAASAVQAMLNAAQPPLMPPAHVTLRDGDLAFWHGIVRARARDEWSDADVVVGVQLARVQADIERESRLLDAERSIVENARGTPTANPRAGVLDLLARRELALMRSLRMGGAAAGEARHVVERRRLARQAERVRADLADDDLLA